MLTMKARSNLLSAVVTACAVGAYGALAIVASCSSSDNPGGAGGSAVGGGGTGGGGTGGGSATGGNSSTGGSSGSGGVIMDASSERGTGGSSGSGGRAEAGPPPACDGGANGCTPGGCPPPAAGRVCCLHKYNDNSVQGTSTTPDGCQDGTIIECLNNLVDDPRGCPQENMCCGVLPDVPGGLTGSHCIPVPLSAPDTFCGTNPYICGAPADGGQVSATTQCRPGAGTAPAYVCAATAGTPASALQVCVAAAADAGGGG